jgi:hypothetical protein
MPPKRHTQTIRQVPIGVTAHERSEPTMSWTVAYFCGNVYTVPPDRCDAFDDMPVGSLPPGSGKTMRFSGTTVLRVENGLLTEEIGLDDGVTALKVLGLIPQKRHSARAPATRGPGTRNSRPWRWKSTRQGRLTARAVPRPDSTAALRGIARPLEESLRICQPAPRRAAHPCAEDLI